MTAEVFGKRHDNVLRGIRMLNCSEKFQLANFGESSYMLENTAKSAVAGKSYPFFNMTRDGWTFLVMGFTGVKAARFKERYIEAFNRYEAGFYKRIEGLLRALNFEEAGNAGRSSEPRPAL